MITHRTLADLLASFAERGDAPALVAHGTSHAETVSYAGLAHIVGRVVAGLIAHGVGRGEPVGLLGPNSSHWVAAYIAIVSAGATAMPFDEFASDDNLASALTNTKCRLVFASATHARRAPFQSASAPTVMILGDQWLQDDRRSSWETLPADTRRAHPPISPEDIAMIVHTSGTTGSPKAVPLSHANLIANLNALLAERLVKFGDRVLLPLPLHHIYPLMGGLLVPLASGATVVFPAGISGPEIREALQRSRATHLVGVPRFYEALLSTIRARLRGRGKITAAIGQLLLVASIWARRRIGLKIGRILFRRLHKEIAPSLGLLVSGGAALDPEVESALEGLGWDVLTGYGLTEAAPILTFNRMNAKRIGTAGLPLKEVALRIANPDQNGVGEIQARGPNVFAGYRDNQDATRAAFSSDGWFRTGDLGFMDTDGFLHIVARATETIVLSDGKKIFPESVEEIYADHPLIREVAVLSDAGVLVALIVPNLDAIRALGASRVEASLREALAESGSRLPSYARVAGFAVIRDALPRTHLGKLRRHLLRSLYARAREGHMPPPTDSVSVEDEALLASPAGARLWAWLHARFPDRPLSLDTSPQLDLGVDSLGWIDLTLDMQNALGITLTEDSIARVITLRDLLREASAATAQSAESLSQRLPVRGSWLTEHGPGTRTIQWILAALNRVILRGVFRLEVRGVEHLPRECPFVICPNHASFLDPFAIAAALPWPMLRRTYWGGWTGLLFKGPVTRWFSRVAQVIPVDPDRAVGSSLSLGAAVLDHGHVLVWFPEGARSPDGQLQRFNPGIGVIVDRHKVPIVPALIAGTFDAWPRKRRWPRLASIAVSFDRPVSASALESAGHGKSAPERIANGVRDIVLTLGAASNEFGQRG
ncbi:MAG: AMP-binding protein [Rhodospirillales bacterium]|nr:AMP-binding protein [Acidimicrobiia bacterium]MBM3950032.1 AMP-binding protein [Rhodospirillales bacterium]